MKRMMLIGALALFAGLAHAQAPATAPAGDAIHSMVQHVNSQAYLFELYLGDGLNAWKEANAAADKGVAYLTADIKPALAAAEGRPDLVAAIKALYVSAKTYFDSAHTPMPMPTYNPRSNNLYAPPEAMLLKSNQAKMKADVDAKINAVKLEADLAGLAAG
jgi:hypothetical protein